MLGPLLLLVLTLFFPFHLLITAIDAGSDIALHFLRAPPAFSASPLAAFQFEIINKGNFSVISCGDCRFTCKVINFYAVIIISIYIYIYCFSKEKKILSIWVYLNLSDRHLVFFFSFLWILRRNY